MLELVHTLFFIDCFIYKGNDSFFCDRLFSFIYEIWLFALLPTFRYFFKSVYFLAIEIIIINKVDNNLPGVNSLYDPF